ncbi:hypothetical protein LCGC14_2817690 [marine sediment metagenome]|uniref:Uncharacterized protein n=1 Tax=marine sediment metagenome TaxID=412755 RepID=A0A0F8YI04_9ZZZZ
MGEPLTIEGLHLLGEQVLICIKTDLRLTGQVEEQDIELLQNISDTLDKREKRSTAMKETYGSVYGRKKN